MRLVPKQPQRAGMSSDVPYNGGRLSPAQAYAVSHASARAYGGGDPDLISQPPAPPSGGESRLRADA